MHVYTIDVQRALQRNQPDTKKANDGRKGIEKKTIEVKNQ